MAAPFCLALEPGTPSDSSGWSPEPRESPSDSRYISRARVLVVDDEHIVRTWIARVLEEAGHDVVMAVNGADALRLAREDTLGFDLVITDVRMPVMDGWQLGHSVGEEWPGIPVLYISGYDLTQYGPSAPAFLRKPFGPEDLLLRVGELLQGD